MDRIMQENQLYIEEWKKWNPNLADALILDGFTLYKDEQRKEQVSIKDVYLPEILQNEKLRKMIHKIDKDTLFQLITLYVQTNEILHEKPHTSPILIRYELKKEQNGSIFLVFEDDFHKKYRYNTSQPEKVIEIYEMIKKQKGEVTLNELGREMKYAAISK